MRTWKHEEGPKKPHVFLTVQEGAYPLIFTYTGFPAMLAVKREICQLFLASLSGLNVFDRS